MSSSYHKTVPNMLEKTEEHENRELAAQSALRWGKTPSCTNMDRPLSELPEDHPVHKIPLKKQQKMRQKGINPVLKAEMDEAMGGEKSGGKFWKKYGTTSMGPWMV